MLRLGPWSVPWRIQALLSLLRLLPDFSGAGSVPGLGIEVGKGNNERNSLATNYCGYPNPSVTPNDIPSLRFSITEEVIDQGGSTEWTNGLTNGVLYLLCDLTLNLHLITCYY